MQERTKVTEKKVQEKETKVKTIYISGKIGESQLSATTIEKFKTAEDKLLNEGWDVCNPTSPAFQYDAQTTIAESERDYRESGFGVFNWYAWLLMYDLHMLAVCDAIYMLEDWQESPGATAEYAYAKACGKEIIYAGEASGPLVTIDQAVCAFGESNPRFAQLMGSFERYLRKKYQSD